MFILPKTTKFTLGTFTVRTPGGNPEIRPVVINKTYNNIPVNISLVETLGKGHRNNSQVPEATVYTIGFYFSQGSKAWYFETKEERDKEYDCLLNIGTDENGNV